VKQINTLVDDIYATIKNKPEGWFSDEAAKRLGEEITKNVRVSLTERRTPKLRLSAMGPKCPKALWHSIHTPELAEPLPPWAEIKFTYGHVLEALALTLATSSGHTVTGEQDELVVDGIKGHRDAVIDGCLVDVKSASSRMFQKFKSGTIAQDDPFGYLDQLDGYLVGSAEDPLVTVKDRGYFLVVDKVLGHLCLYEHRLRERSIRERIADAKTIVERTEPPHCRCGTVAVGQSGNIGLDTKASYSAFKYCCFPELRTFLYASGPVYLTKVVRKPDVVEIDKYGKIRYN
jgi:hypothetical protein